MRLNAVGLLCCVLLVSCGKDEGPTGPNAENGDFAVTVGAGTAPNYSWSEGGAFSVSVVRTSAPGTIVWGVADPMTKNIASPLKHGVRTGSAVESATAEKTLSAGIEYRVSVTLANGKTGWKEFRP